jgi:hypothetical protein
MVMTVRFLSAHHMPGRMPGSTAASEPCRKEQAKYLPLLFLIAIALIFLLQGCSTPVRLAAVPKDQQAAAVVDGMPGIRYWQKEDLAVMQQVRESAKIEITLPK